MYWEPFRQQPPYPYANVNLPQTPSTLEYVPGKPQHMAPQDQDQNQSHYPLFTGPQPAESHYLNPHLYLPYTYQYPYYYQNPYPYRFYIYP